ncbi:MAG: hypothetical protein ACKOC5_00595 [Chloroflexota bacterium]
MIFQLKEMLDIPAIGADGELGRVSDVYFDVDRWRVRYLELEAGEWLEQRRLVFSTQAFRLHPERREVRLELSHAQVRQSPALQLNQPLNRDQEIELHRFYNWPFYWEGERAGGLGPDSPAAIPLIELAAEVREQMASNGALADPRLHRLSSLLGAALQARDGGAGTLDGLLAEDSSWNILYLLIQTGGLLSAKTVRLSPQFVTTIDEDAGRIDLDLDSETVRHSPEVNPGKTE